MTTPGLAGQTATSRRKTWVQMSLRQPPHVHEALQKAAEAAEQTDVDYVREAVYARLVKDGYL
jgi:predicted HicB family RNase H-like nuclease